MITHIVFWEFQGSDVESSFEEGATAYAFMQHLDKQGVKYDYITM